jgi:hypothetical protein
MQGYWVLFINGYGLTPGIASMVCFYDSAVNTINTLVAVNALTCAPYPILGDFVDCIGWKQWAGIALFTVGISIEMIAEESRKRFKKNPRNKGKIDDTGLWYVPLWVPDIIRVSDATAGPSSGIPTTWAIPCGAPVSRSLPSVPLFIPSHYY